MNKSFFVALSVSLLICVCSCKKGNSAAGTAAESMDGVEEVEKGQPGVGSNMKRKAVPVMHDFYSITSIGSIDIVYTQGEKTSIDVEGDPGLLDLVKAEVDCGVLTISLETQANPNLSHYDGRYGVTAYITCPDLYIVALCRSGRFRSEGAWKTDKNVNFAAYSTGSFDVKELECKSFRMESSGEDKSRFGMIAAAFVYFYFRGAAEYKVGVNTPSFMADLAVGTVLEATGHADHHVINGTSMGKFVNNLR